MLDGRSVEDKSAQGLSVRPHKSVHGCFRGRDKEGSQEAKLWFIPLLKKRCQAESQRLACLLTVMYSFFDLPSIFLFVQVEFSYPPLKPEEGHDSHSLPEEWKYLPFLALPDGAHNYQEGKKQEEVVCTTAPATKRKILISEQLINNCFLYQTSSTSCSSCKIHWQ